MSAPATDVLVIGAGVQGVGVAQAAAAAGHRVLLLERERVAAGTSGKSSKLIHGGLRYLESMQLRLVRESIREGEGIAQPLGESGIFDDLVVNMVDVGEETGELDKMLMKIADNYDEEVDNAVNALVSLLQPLLIVGLGGAVFVIVLSVFLPMLTLIDTLGGG